MTEQKNKQIWFLIVLLVAVIVGLVAWNMTQRNELNEILEQMTIEKEELQEDILQLKEDIYYIMPVCKRLTSNHQHHGTIFAVESLQMNYIHWDKQMEVPQQLHHLVVVE